MDIQPQNQQPISDDQELAKVLAGVSQQNNDSSQSQVATPSLPQAPMTPPELPTMPDSIEALEQPVIETPEPVSAYVPEPALPATSVADDSLEAIKKDALNELRPLVDKLDVSPEEKFDTYLLLIRSTDDQALIAPAHEAARGISDEARRAQALLDIVKEIDYLSAPRQAA